MYKVKEIFKSIQGEGSLAGTSTVFLRFANCNLNCPFCDTDWTEGEDMEGSDILKKLGSLVPFEYVCFTGGEPTLQLDGNLANLIKSTFGCSLSIETNGSNLIEPGLAKLLDHITVSPKLLFQPQKTVEQNYGTDLKLLYQVGMPYSSILEYEQYHFENFYIQPIWPDSKSKTDPEENRGYLMNVRHALGFIAENHKWKISVQVHKYLGLE